MAKIVPHGTLDYSELARLNISADDLRVFSSNSNPYGPPQAILDAVSAAVTGPLLGRYPDRLSSELRRPLADYHGVAPDSIVVGNGTADLMWLVGLLYVRARRVAILEPTFGEYANIAALLDTPYASITLPGWTGSPTGTYAPSSRTLQECLDELRAEKPEVVFLCNPNNPTGELLNRADLKRMLEAAPNAIWIVDEAYMEFAAEAWSAASFINDAGGPGSVIVLRSMTKDFSLGGIRLGYLVAKQEIARQIQTAQPPWNVNILAQAAGLAAMQNLAWRRDSLAQLRKDTEALRAQFVRLGLEPRSTTTNYFLTTIDDPADLRRALLADGILIRDCTSFGLPNYFRVATQLPDDNAELVAAIRRYMQEPVGEHA